MTRPAFSKAFYMLLKKVKSLDKVFAKLASYKYWWMCARSSRKEIAKSIIQSCDCHSSIDHKMKHPAFPQPLSR